MASKTEVLTVVALCSDVFIADVFDDEQQAREANKGRSGKYEVQPLDLRFRPDSRRFVAVCFPTLQDATFSPWHALMPLPSLSQPDCDFESNQEIEFRERRDWRTREAAMAYVAAKNRELMANEDNLDDMPEWWAVVEISLPVTPPLMYLSFNNEVGTASLDAHYGCRLVTPTPDEIDRLAR